MDEMIQKMDIVMSSQPMMASMAFVIFLVGLTLPGVLLKRENNSDNRKTILALAGMVNYDRTLFIHAVHALTIILPVIVLTYAFATTMNPG